MQLLPDAASLPPRSRRQQVTPEPQPISSGSIAQGMPERSTKRMPVSTARSSTRGRPPFLLTRRLGRSGSTVAHSSSVTNAFMPDEPRRINAKY